MCCLLSLGGAGVSGGGEAGGGEDRGDGGDDDEVCVVCCNSCVCIHHMPAGEDNTEPGSPLSPPGYGVTQC